MDLNSDAMLVSLNIAAWSGRLYDRDASTHVAVHHDASASAGRYNKRLLPKAAFAALNAALNKARATHYEQTMPWDDKGARGVPVRLSQACTASRSWDARSFMADNLTDAKYR